MLAVSQCVTEWARALFKSGRRNTKPAVCHIKKKVSFSTENLVATRRKQKVLYKQQSARSATPGLRGNPTYSSVMWEVWMEGVIHWALVKTCGIAGEFFLRYLCLRHPHRLLE